MVEIVKQWSPAQKLDGELIAREGIAIRSVAGVEQWLVSGDLGAAGQLFGVDPEGVGAWGIASGARYSVRLARDRMLIVDAGGSAAGDVPADGWHAGGVLVSQVSAGFHVFEARGRGIADLVKRGTPLDLRTGSPSASVLFAGVAAVLYRQEVSDVLRLHVDRGLASYLADWFRTQV